MRGRPRSRYEDEYGCIRIGTDIKLEPEYPEVIAWDKEYADECDRLSEIAAKKTHKRRWGRWHLNTSYGLVSLDTRVWLPEIEDHPAWQGDDYYIVLNGCRTEKGCQEQIEHMTEKRWLGEKGIKDLGRALTELARASYRRRK